MVTTDADLELDKNKIRERNSTFLLFFEEFTE